MVSKRYVSNELSHFVGKHLREDEHQQYDLLLEILKSGWLTFPPHDPSSYPGWVMHNYKQISSNEMCEPRMICFCDIPITDIELHTTRYGRCGLSFSKDFIIGKGGAPVQYVPRDTAVMDVMLTETTPVRTGNKEVSFIREAPLTKNADLFDKMVEEYNDIFYNHLFKNTEIHDQARKLLIFLNSRLFGYLKFYDHTHPEAHEDNYYMEREWRVLVPVNFAISDVQTIFLPKEFAQNFSKDFPEYYSQLTLL